MRCFWVNLFVLIVKSVVAITKYPLKPAHANSVYVHSFFIYLPNCVLEIKPTRANGTLNASTCKLQQPEGGTTCSHADNRAAVRFNNTHTHTHKHHVNIVGKTGDST